MFKLERSLLMSKNAFGAVIILRKIFLSVAFKICVDCRIACLIFFAMQNLLPKKIMFTKFLIS